MPRRIYYHPPLAPCLWPFLELQFGNVYGRLSADSGTDANPVAINVELHKVGRGSEGGDLIIGGKHSEGIPDFHVDVLGDDTKPSDLGTLGSTNSDLENVYISTHADYVNGDTFASLTIRDGFGQGTVDLVDADAFYGDLTLGSTIPIDDLVTLRASGGGDVNFTGLVDANGNAYSYTTGAGDDTFVVTLDGNAVDTIGESFAISTGGGADTVTINGIPGDPQAGVSQLTMEILDNMSINTGAGDDVVVINNNFRFNIEAGAGSDFVYINSQVPGLTGAWIIGTNTGPATFVDRVLYKAELTVTFAGFESTVTVDTDAAGNFIADQITINNAIKAAIDQNPELDRLLTYTDGTGGRQLTITSLVDGDNNLSIELDQPVVVVSGATGAQVDLATADVSSLGAGLVMTGAATDSAAVATAALVVAEMGTAGALEGNLDATGTAIAPFLTANAGTSANAAGAGNVNFSVINMGTGANDLVVMDSNVNSANVLVIDQTFGKVSVVNFFDVSPDLAVVANVGNHAIDYTSFLSNKTSATSSTLSEVDVAVTLNTLAVLNPTSPNAVANSVNMFRFDSTVATTETFAGLTGTVLLAALNDAAQSYGGIVNTDLSATYTTTNLVGTTQHHIVKVENDNNPGEYKVFYLTSSTTDDGTANAGRFTNATLLGTLDFGASINFQLVGSTAWETLIETLIANADGINPAVTVANIPGAGSYDLVDSAANLAGAAPAQLDGATNITANTDADVAQATVIEGAGNIGTTTYDVTDTADTIVAAALTTAITGATAVTATTAALTVTQADTLEGLPNLDAASVYTLVDTGAALTAVADWTAYPNATAVDANDDAFAMTAAEFADLVATGIATTAGDTITVDENADVAGVTVDGTGQAASLVLIGGTGADTLTGGDAADTITGGAGADIMTGGAGADTFVIGATDSLNTALDTITDYTAGTDILDLAVVPTTLIAGAAAAQFTTAADVASTGVDAAALAADIATAVTAQIVVDATFWDSLGDTIAVTITGASVAGTDAIYIVQNQAADATYDAAADTVVGLIGTSTVPTVLADFA